MNVEVENEWLKLWSEAFANAGIAVAAGGVLTPVIAMAIGQSPTVDQQWSIGAVMLGCSFLTAKLFWESNQTIKRLTL